MNTTDDRAGSKLNPSDSGSSKKAAPTPTAREPFSSPCMLGEDNDFDPNYLPDYLPSHLPDGHPNPSKGT